MNAYVVTRSPHYYPRPDVGDWIGVYRTRPAAERAFDMAVADHAANVEGATYALVAVHVRTQEVVVLRTEDHDLTLDFDAEPAKMPADVRALTGSFAFRTEV